MSRNVRMELPLWQGNEYVFSCLTLNWVLLMLEQYGCPNTSTHKNDFSLTPFFSNPIQLYQNVAFDNHFKSLRVSLSSANIWNKDVKICLPFSLQHWESSCVSWIKKYSYCRKISFCYLKNLSLTLINYNFNVIINSM